MGFCRDVLGKDPYSCTSDGDNVGQVEVLESIRDNPVTNVAAGHNTGKSALAAFAALWFFETRTDCAVVTTAPTWAQVEEIIWREIGAAWGNAAQPLGGVLLTTSAEFPIPGSDGRSQWYMTGRSVRDPNHFQGLHAPGGVLVVADEGNAIPEVIYDRAETLGAQEGSRQLRIGNPYLRSGTMYEDYPESMVEKDRTGISNLRMSSLNAPPHVCSPDWIEQRKRRLGPNYEANPLWSIQVLGRWATSSEFGLFPLELVQECAQVVPSGEVCGGRSMGVDVARFGTDRSVAVLLVDGIVSALHSWEKTDTMRTAALTLALAEKWQVAPARCGVDVVGVGGGVVDRLHELGYGCQAVNVGESPRGDWAHLVGRDAQFVNRRAELYWVVRRLLDEHALSIPETYRMIWTDLVAMPYRYDGRGRLLIPPKDQLRKDLGRSPDFADALTLALSRPVRGGHVGSIKRGGRMPRVG